MAFSDRVQDYKAVAAKYLEQVFRAKTQAREKIAPQIGTARLLSGQSDIAISDRNGMSKAIKECSSQISEKQKLFDGFVHERNPAILQFISLLERASIDGLPLNSDDLNLVLSESRRIKSCGDPRIAPEAQVGLFGELLSSILVDAVKEGLFSGHKTKGIQAELTS